MKNFYQYLENIRNITLYENTDTDTDITKLKKKAETDYKYNKELHTFKRRDDRLPDFLKVVLDKNNWSTSGRRDSHRICFLVNNQEKYELYTISTDVIPDNVFGSTNNHGVVEGVVQGWHVNNNNEIEEIELDQYAKTLGWIYSNKIY